MLKAMEKNPQERYDSAQDLADDLRRWRDDQPIRARRPSLRQRATRWARRHRPVVGSVVVVLLVTTLLGGATWGWWAHQRGKAEDAVRIALEEAAQWQQQERWPEALSAVRRAEGILAHTGADPTLRQQVEQRSQDLEMARRLDEAIERTPTQKSAITDGKETCAAYAAAFKWYGLDLERLTPEQAGALIRHSPIAVQMAGALDNWASLLLIQGVDGWKQRIAVARASDPDPWRNRLRDALEGGRQAQVLEALVLSAASEELPPTTALLLLHLTWGTPAAHRAGLCLQRVQQRHPDNYQVNLVLAWILSPRAPRQPEALGYARAALALRPLSSATHHLLGNILVAHGRIDEASAEYRRAIELDPKNALPHDDLGKVLHNQQQVDEAIKEFRRTIELDPGDVSPHYNLGLTFLELGRLSEARESMRRCLQLLSQNDPLRESATQQLHQCEQFLALDQKLSAILEGKEKPAHDADLLVLAQLCQQPFKKLYGASCRFFTEAFANDARLADDMQKQHRYNAACAAALAGSGQGTDAAKLDHKERARLRRQAVAWLRADLVHWTRQAESSKPGDRGLVQETLKHWQDDSDLAGLRDKDALKRLPAEEREAVRKLWDDMDALVRQSNAEK